MKFSQPENIKRIGIFFFYDTDGVVDDYILHLLEDLKESVGELLIVCNGALSPEGKLKFEKLNSEILTRENKGFDIGAYKVGLEHYGWEKLSGYDEVVLFNFTIMGPLYPFREMFEEMSRKDLDFWGITRNYGMEFDPWRKSRYGYIPMHIQNCFIVIRSSMIKSEEFQRYWENISIDNDDVESIRIHEFLFTKEFTDKGFLSDTYVDTDDLKEYIDDPLMFYPKELISNRKCPVFKRDTFSGKYEEFLDVSCGQAGYELYQFLMDKTNYDLNYIWDTLLRIANISDIKERMQLNYILPSRVRLPKHGEPPRVALFMHIYFMDQVEYCKGYAASMPTYADIYLTTNSEEKKSILEEAFRDFDGRKVKVVVAENRGREISAHIIALRPYVGHYDFVCFAHDKKTTHLKPYIKGESFSYHCFENVLASPVFVENVIDTFAENPRLGLLVPPTPIHSDFYIVLGDEWQKNYDNACQVADRLKLSVNIDRDKPPISPLGGIYWYRTEALKPLFEADFHYEDFPQEPIQETDGTIMHAIERLYPFVAQQKGFYTGWVLSDSFSKMELTNLNKILRDFNRILLLKFGKNSRYTHMDILSNSDITTLAQTLHTLSIQIYEKEKTILMLSAQVDEKEKAVQMLSAQLEQVMETNAAQMAEKEQAAQALRWELDQTTKDLELTKLEITSYSQSTSWKITKPIRMIKNAFQSFRK